MTTPIVPLILRGELITDHLIEVPGRGGNITFFAGVNQVGCTAS